MSDPDRTGGADEIEPAGPTPAGTGFGRGVPGLKGSGILVVEDDPMVAEILTACLEGMGIPVSGVAAGADEAVRLAESGKPDLVLMDIDLSRGADGIEAARRIAEGPGTPIIFLTGHTEEALLRRAEEVHPYGYLLKPFQPASLSATVRMALSRASLEEALRESEERLRAVVDGSSDAILLVDRSTGEVLQENPALAGLLGGARPSPSLGCVSSLLGPDASRDLEGALRGPRQTFLRRADGEPLAVEVTAHAIPAAGRDVLCVFVRELSARARAGEAILRAKVEWEQTFDAIPDLVSILDARGRVVRVNRAMARAVGLTPQEAVGRDCCCLVHGTSTPPEGCPRAASVTDGDQHESEVFLADSGRTYVETVSPLRGLSGEMTGFVRVARDITGIRRTESELRHRERFLERLNALAEAALEASEPAALHQLAADGIRDLLGGDAAGLALWDDEEGVGRVVAASGRVPADLVGLRSQPGERTLTEEVLRSGRPLLLEDARSFPGSHALVSRLDVASLSVFPLVAGQPAGALFVGFRERRVPKLAETALGEIAARQVSLALVKTRLLEEGRRQAVTDFLTGLRNRRGFFELARREVDRALRFRRPLAVLALDVDAFKKVNDHFGHAAGDEVLKGVATRLASVVREVDVLGRTGGDEFCVVLPECDGATALEIAERIRRVVAAAPVESIRGAVQATLSVGIGLLGPEAEDLAGLLEAADRSLYEAKAAGRNVVALRPRSG